MKRAPPSDTATTKELVRYLHELHECQEQNHAETTERLDRAQTDRDQIGHQMRSGGWRQDVGLVGVFLALLGMTIAAKGWADKMETAVAPIPAMAIAASYRDVRLAHIDSEVQTLQDIATANNQTLVGTYHAAQAHKR